MRGSGTEAELHDRLLSVTDLPAGWSAAPTSANTGQGVASTSSAYAWAFTFSGVHIGVDLVLFYVGPYAGLSHVRRPGTA